MLYVKDIILKCGGVLVCGNENLVLENFSKDTRTISAGDTYVGIKGENFDGNEFYKDAIDKGAKICILDNIDENLIPSKYLKSTIVKVKDSILCLQTLARYKRSLYDIPVIGITGSVGKTSTKEMVSSVLETKYKVLKTEGNNNNHIGLPLTILRLKDEDVMVLEMGMNNKGEISLLTGIAKPTIAVITNIGTAHIGKLGSRENIMAAKMEITEGLSGPLVINYDNDILHDNIDMIRKNNEVITLGIDNVSDYMATDISDDLSNFKINGDDITCPIGNKAFIYNSLVSYVVGKLCEVSSLDIKKGIMNFKLTGNRLNYIKLKDDITVIDDSYNASLDSIEASLEILKKEKGTRKLAVIGDILETGEFSRDIHTEVGKVLLNSNLDVIVTIGEETKYTDEYLTNNGYETKYHFSNEKDSHDTILGLLKKGDTILFKGSHGMKLSNIAEFLVQKKGNVDK